MRYWRLFCILAVSAAVSCASGGETETPAGDGFGTLDIASLTAEVSQATRAVSADDFIVRILDSEGELLGDEYEWTVSTKPAQLTLKAGNYTLEVCAPWELHDAKWDSPWYGASKDFVITAKETTTMQDITCTLGNMLVTVHYSGKLKEVLEDANVTVTVDGGTLPFVYGEKRAGYFAVPGGKADMTVEFVGTIDGFEEKTTHVVEVEPGDWKRVLFTFGDEGEPVLVIVYDSSAGQIGDGDDWF